MSCPKCETGLLVIETVTTGGFQFEQWRCVNCGKRMNEEEYMGWTEEQRKQHSERMKKNWVQRPRGPKKFKPVILPKAFTAAASCRAQEPLDLMERTVLEQAQAEALEEEEAIVKKMDAECAQMEAEAARYDTRSPAVAEIDGIIAEMEEDIERINQEVTTLRSIRARLVQRQGS